MNVPLLPPSLIASLSTLDESAMPDTCVITEPGTRVVDGQGQSTTVPGATTTVACRFVSQTGDTRDADQRKEQGTYQLYIPKTASCPRTSKVVYNTRSYRVVFTPPVTGYSTSRVVGLEDA